MFRLRKALFPFICSKRPLLDDDNYDLYGPIWIMITLIIEITIVGFINYQIDVETMMFEIKHGKTPTNYLSLYSLEKVGRAAFVMIGYFILNPLMLYLLAKYVVWVQYIEYTWIFCIYGYSFTTFIITTALTVVPVSWMNWAVLGYSGFMSMLFIFMEMYDLIKNRLKQSMGKFFLLALWLIVTHVVFILSLQLYFLA